MVHLFDAVGFVGVFDRGHQPVDDADQQDAGEEARHGDNRAEMRSPLRREGGVGLLEQFDERDVDHHAARQSQRERQQPFVGSFGEECDGASDARRKTCAERQQQGDQDIGFFHTIIYY